MKKLVTLLLVLVCAFSLTACGGSMSVEEENGDKIVITIHNYDGGVGTQWLHNAQERFESAYKDKQYSGGKTGVKLDIEPNQEQRISTMASSGINVFFFEQHYDIRNLAQGGLLLNLNDVIKEKDDKYTRNGTPISIEDKISDENRITLKGADGNYYGLPHYSWYPGLSYDVELFNKYNLYIADTSVNSGDIALAETKFGSINLIKNSSVKKSCGVDGKYDTADDGLPTSLQEFLILCQYMKQEYSIQPITCSGKYTYYSTYLVEALWASLAGYDQMRTLYTYNGTMDVIDYSNNGGFSDENLFQGVNYVKKPNVKQVTITEATGYQTYDSVYRYYATALLNVLFKEELFSQDITSSSSHTEAQGNFIMNGKLQVPEMAMLVEGSYWYNETEEKAGNLSDYYDITKKSTRDIRWMSLPTMATGSATPVADEEPARKNTVVETGASYMIVNANISNNEGLVEAIKDFIKFIYSDNELKEFTKVTSLSKAMINYDMGTYTGNEAYRKSITEFTKNNNVVYASADNKTFIKNGNDVFKLRVNAPVFAPKFNSVTYTCYYEAFKNSKSLQDVFDNTRIKQAEWSGYYVA